MPKHYAKDTMKMSAKKSKLPEGIMPRKTNTIEDEKKDKKKAEMKKPRKK